MCCAQSTGQFGPVIFQGPSCHVTFTARRWTKGVYPFPPLHSSPEKPFRNLCFLYFPAQGRPCPYKKTAWVSLNHVFSLGPSGPPACGWKFCFPSHRGHHLWSAIVKRHGHLLSLAVYSAIRISSLEVARAAPGVPFGNTTWPMSPTGNAPPCQGPAFHACGRSPTSTRPVSQTRSPQPHPGSSPSHVAGPLSPPGQCPGHRTPPPPRQSHVRTTIVAAALSRPASTKSCKWQTVLPSPVHPPTPPGLLCLPGSLTSVGPGPLASRVSPVSRPCSPSPLRRVPRAHTVPQRSRPCPHALRLV